MATTLVRRTGDPIKISWTYPVSKEDMLDSFRVDIGGLDHENWQPLTSDIDKTTREFTFPAPVVSSQYTVSSVKGLLAGKSRAVIVIVSNAPDAPDNIDLS